ncbi:MAG TPA: hypothetical protein VKB76_08395, partial [Ktedonobacterales bacterium]|nr:hypothetical protein [Ktedonobacterales bacterium]
AISGLSPTTSIDQYLTNRSPRSTVGTTTEIYTYLRVLFARLGHRVCPACGEDVPPLYDESPIDWADDAGDDTTEVESSVRCPHCGVSLPEIGMANFSFNKPAGACPTCTGLGIVRQANLQRIVNEALSIVDGAINGWDIYTIRRHTETMRTAARYYGFNFDSEMPVKGFSPAQRDLLFFGTDSQQFQRHFPQIEPPTTVNQGRFEGIANTLLRRYAEHIQDADYLQKLDEFLVTQTCPDCGGTRLRAESRAVTVASQTIIALSQLSLTDLADWLEALPTSLSDQEMLIARPILDGLHERVRRVLEVGVEYLTLDRDSPSLSAGEARRLRMSSLLGSSLSGMLYVFDEPTIGLHSRDTQRLIGVLRRLRDLDNTVLVIEHDLELI